jgi:hypothetical protein
MKNMTEKNDIDLFKLTKKANFNKHIKRINLPKENQNISNSFECVAIGWGEIESNINNIILL